MRFVRVACACSLLIGLRSSALSQSTGEVSSREIQFFSDGVELAATLYRPTSAGPVPGVVIVHGSGASARDNPWTTAWVRALSSRGIAVLYPDKRGSGASKGDWRLASLETLAGDASAALRALRASDGIDTSRVGAIGFSQGGKVVAVLAAKDSLSRFTGVVSSSTNTFREQLVEEIASEARQRSQPLDSAEHHLLSSIYEQAFRVARTGGWNALTREVAAARASSPRLAHALRTMPDDSTHWAVGFIRAVGDFDPMVYWKDAKHPVFFLLGGRDTQVNVPESVRALWNGVGLGNSLFSLLILQGSGHGIFRDDAVEFVSEWVRTRGR